MKRKTKKVPDRMRDEYDFAGGTRGNYARRMARDASVVVLDPDVAKAFRDSAAVNEALRALIQSPRKRKRAE